MIFFSDHAIAVKEFTTSVINSHHTTVSWGQRSLYWTGNGNVSMIIILFGLVAPFTHVISDHVQCCSL